MRLARPERSPKRMFFFAYTKTAATAPGPYRRRVPRIVYTEPGPVTNLSLSDVTVLYTHARARPFLLLRPPPRPRGYVLISLDPGPAPRRPSNVSRAL